MDSIITKQPATVISVNGNVHVKVNGKDVHLSELTDITLGTEIIVPEGADALLALEDGSVLPIGVTETDELSLDSFSQDAEIAALQALLLNENFDPTQELEATAAGGSTSNTGSQTPTTISRAASETLAKAGYDTEGVSREFNTVRVERGDTTDTRLASGNDGSAPTEPLTPSVPTPTIDATFTISSDTNGKDIVEGGEIAYIVTLNEQAQEDITITLSNGENITVLAGETVGQVTVSTREDDLYKDDDKELTVTIENISENSFDSSTPEGMVTNQVVDDNDTVTVKLFVTDENGNILHDSDGNPLDSNSVVEGGDVYYVAQLVDEGGNIIEGAAGEVTINFSELNNSDDQKDYSQSGTSITVNLGDKIAAETIDDYLSEGEESFAVSVSLTDEQKDVLDDSFENVLVDGLISTTIEDDRATGNPDVDEDVRPNVTIEGGDTVTEANGVYLTYTAKLDGPAADDITASLTLGGNATQGSDYGNLQVKINGQWVDYSDSITLPADGTDVELRVPVLDDKLAESDETVSVTVSTTSDLVTGNQDSASGTIEDDDLNVLTTKVKVSEEAIPNSGIKEPNGDEDDLYRTAKTTISLDGESPEHVTIGFKVDDSGKPVFESDPSLKSDGEEVNWSIVDGLLIGHTGQEVTDQSKVISIELHNDTDGDTHELSYVVELHKPIDHHDIPDNTEGETDQIRPIATVTGNDGTELEGKSGDVTLNFIVEDDMPKAINSPIAVVDVPSGVASGLISAQYGADGKGSLSWSPFGGGGTSANNNSDTGFTVGGKKVLIEKGDADGHMLIGYIENTTTKAFQLELNPETGQWTFNQFENMLETNGNADGVLDIHYAIVDGDGDKANGTVSIDILDGTEFDPTKSGNDAIYSKNESISVGYGNNQNYEPGGNESTSVNGLLIDGEIYSFGDIWLNQEHDNYSPLSQANVINSGAGNDHIEAGGGNDLIYLGEAK
ncbi:immunoglobulin-like domain-containing protein [Enterovibrio norvegicus]|uniref:immunoglobulin-like domain-containing protein n=1 Tax=Enterovibrio norvegicus TaxID=188144 RepID=UPI0024B14AFC|nr:immunoglobulin-like domain-containing protein [Enterovibrio norvegicus]